MISNLISAIVLNWNGKEVIFDCLDSLLAQTYAQKEIIVVDNGSEDGSFEMIQTRYGSKVQFIKSETNLGFAGGCNLGIRAAKGEFIALIGNLGAGKTTLISILCGLIKPKWRLGRRVARAAMGAMFFYREFPI